MITRFNFLFNYVRNELSSHTINGIKQIVLNKTSIPTIVFSSNDEINTNFPKYL